MCLYRLQTFECQHKVIESILILSVGFLIVLLYVFVDSTLNNLNGFL
jgi:hypothetical protein